ncbi:Cleavage and polyadenylation specificity factor CPSF30 [Apostasia shenzhenica]|uniref:YTH domain-containing family protein n=1 Tax=Apostasia shenzhenica TaxID=1088818 RepID=A0A2I0A7L3_9ASPA|nr:Cleavage and polyadenylation specificity factor CPSF30 [Apostasia shenzhenica]
MDSEVTPELIFDPFLGLYYPTGNDYYNYYYTAPEPSTEWDSHHQAFGLDGQDLQFSTMQTESLPNVYYIPSYGYVQSPYNPYNPTIPGAAVGTEASVVETHYPANPPHQLLVSSPAYIPLALDSSSNTLPNGYLNPLLASNGALQVNIPDSDGKRLTPSIATFKKPAASIVGASPQAIPEAFQSSCHPRMIPKVTDGSVANTASSKQSATPVLIGGSIPIINQGANHLANLKVPSVYRPTKVAIPENNDITGYRSHVNHLPSGDKFRPRLAINRVLANRNGALTEQNRGPRTDISKDRWTSLTLRAFTANAGATDSQGSIVISSQHYNRVDFPIDYADAKFFVIKSYSEDDVHKSIKYNVWSSTPSGNKRLESAFEAVQKLNSGNLQKCPIFFFFSVNASGHFCGVAEMTGPVDFQKDMDFWQQDKWNGSFPVKWHIIKDIPNTSLRHILLENNEFKPVTCSRDTQEVPFLQGMAMLRLFKNAPLETSILDDFLHYEERERIMFEEKSTILERRQNDSQIFPAAFVPSENANGVIGKDTTACHEKPAESKNQQDGIVQQPLIDDVVSPGANTLDSNVTNIEQLRADDVNSILKIGSMLINSKDETHNVSSSNDVITIGSMHIKVGPKDLGAPGVLTFGSFPVHPK